MNTLTRCKFNLILLLVSSVTTVTWAQNNPVYIDEAHVASQLLQQADSGAGQNPVESVRLLQEALQNSGDKLVARIQGENPVHFVSVREEVLKRYRENDLLLQSMRNQYTEEAEVLLQAGEYEQVIALYELTEPGHDALLQLGREEIELGALNRGIAHLQRVLEHPDANTNSQIHAWYGIALGAKLLEALELQHQAEQALTSLGEAAAPFLEKIRTMPVLDLELRNYTSYQIAPNTSIEDLVVESIWSNPLQQSLLSRRMEHPSKISNIAQVDLENRANQGWFSTIMPAVRDNLVFINTGQSIIAFDTLTGHVEWSHKRRQLDLKLNPSERPAGANFLDLDGRYLVTVMGHLYGNERSGDGAIICIDAPSGQIRWTVMVDGHPDIDQSEGLFVSSAPIIHEGLVYVLAKRISPQQLISEVLIAIDLIEGKVRWATWIASASRTRRSTITNPTTPLPIHGNVVVTTSTGAIASVNASNGDLQWLHRLTTPQSMDRFISEIRPYNHSQPIVAGDSIVTISPDGTEVLRINLATGLIEEAIPAANPEHWNRPVYLLSTGDQIISVGRDLRCFSMENLREPRFIIPFPADDADSLPVGRVQLLEESVIVPTQDHILQIDLDSGTVERNLAIPRPGNPLVASAQLFVASPTHLDAYTALDRAWSVLQERINSSPDTVSTRLDVVRLASRAGKDELLLPASREVLDLLTQRSNEDNSPQELDEARGQMLEHLISSLKRRDPVEDETGIALSELILETADKPELELKAMLVLGDWMQPGSPEQAAKHWRTILERESLGQSWHEENDLHARGVDWARNRLKELDIEYHPLDKAQWRSPLNPEDGNDVLGSVRENIRYSNDPDRLAKEIPPLIEHLEKTGRSSAQLGLLHAWSRRYPDNPLLVDGDERMAEEWVAEILLEEDDPIGTDGVVEQPSMVQGALLPEHIGAVFDPPTDAYILQRNDAIRRIDASTMKPAWSMRIQSSNGLLLQHDEQRLAIWVNHGDFRPDLLLLDAHTGEELVPMIDVADLFEDMPDFQGEFQAILPDGRMIDPEELLACSNPDSIVVIRRDGHVLGLGGDLGNEIRWYKRLPVRIVHGIHPWPDGVVVIGPDPDSDHPLAVSNAAPLLFHIDHATGSVHRIHWPDAIGRFSWICRSPLNDLILGGEDGIASIGWPDNTPRWINTAPVAKNARQGWASGEAIMIMDQEDNMNLLDVENGREIGAITPPPYRDPGMLRDIRADGNGFRILRTSGLSIHNPTGIMVGTDGIPHEYEFEHLQSRNGIHILLAHRQTVNTPPGRAGLEGRRHLYRIYMLDDSGRILDLLDLFPLRSRIRATRLRGQSLLIETEEAVDFITLPRIDNR